jgi:hypothetical protein
MRAAGKICAVVALAIGFIEGAHGGMPAAEQNSLVQKYCGVCHNDAHVNGGLTLEHFDAASPDPSLMAMLLSKTRDAGAIFAAGLPPPSKTTLDALLDALVTEAAGASKWTISHRGASVVMASIAREASVPPNAPKRSPGDIGAPDIYRLIVACDASTLSGEMLIAWAPGAAPKGSVLSAMVDGKSPVRYTVEGSEKRFNGAFGTMGTGATLLNAKMLPEESLVINDLFKDGKITFPFSDLPAAARKSLVVCFSDK